MLEIIVDNRSGNKVEIVVPVFNEEKRIKFLIDYYSNDFDIVLLDGGSFDLTVELAKNYNITCYKRIELDVMGEEYFAYYVNKITKSETCFYMFADEFVDVAELKAGLLSISENKKILFGNRVDWLYGKKVNKFRNSGSPRGGISGQFKYDSSNLHDSLKVDNSHGIAWIDIHHFHLWTMKKYFGTAGAYAYIEVEEMRKEKFSPVQFIKRFVYNELVKLPYRILRNLSLGPARLVWMFFMSHIIPLLAIVSFIEQKYLMSEREQLEFYKKFYYGEQNV